MFCIICRLQVRISALAAVCEPRRSKRRVITASPVNVASSYTLLGFFRLSAPEIREGVKPESLKDVEF